jgi:hypothetical protein
MPEDHLMFRGRHPYETLPNCGMNPRPKSDLHKFAPNIEVEIACDGCRRTVKAQTITQTGNCLVVTEAVDADGYRLTHRYTGFVLPGVSKDVAALQTLARRFWRALSAENKRVWKTSKDPNAVRGNTPWFAQKILTEFQS